MTTLDNSTKGFEDKLIDLQNNMMNFALTLTSNREEAKDLLQETTLRALDNKEKYYENVNFKGWVFTIMHNIFVNNYRRVVRSQTMIDQTENLYHLNMPQDSGFDTPEGAYTVAEIVKVINNFSDEYKVPFSMHVSGFKYEEIAQQLKLPIGTVKSRIFFARKRLQELLADYKYQDRE
ncbi:RNA polymerase sigma-70 factor (ECF subfamily) [Dysgonomonas sp. PFB1-18]|jgi:RNA polymerase sigma-70 factor (ECF subfamily)|uniref:RNA polymerase sigma factor n=1 Tax=unclassified Dysgonomonas TaxID=2630389 RepID=UPI0024750763|nr:MULTISPECIES: RNA polymerase sigma factor [unclassified Dysgonomonas]MDH6308881.1 RNA polymerase sigma-70 factor (ECF subfamily) [Dysgonomonas sp. PF1-14]MDH6338423.1 RNA polymerase sigma-70 factor (ECF subfamily) [Dysgonomonas sp. PF1-16]MDH6380130.1 RNA polymerase sigma-70 factor (ECF subfamily) [Dysgonomonas sp. PFB1-18]MDH6397251.1 RNA polymerase sigma-70 factor (ECF subfamily) [Dysgonomonas sp. PF1-23]